jgi:hypothetical protein
MAKAQGALEYLAIMAVAIAVITIVSLMMINTGGTQTKEYAFASCRQAATTCNITISMNPTDSCTVCDNACNYTNGTQIFPGAINCCKLGQTTEIYSGSPGCAVECLLDSDCGSGQICCGRHCAAPECTVDADCPHTPCEEGKCQLKENA